MSANRWLLAMALVGLGFISSTHAVEAIRWQTTLESAARLASQTDRLVLIHFWNDGCPPCRRMEEEVFSRPDVAVAIERDYVPVKIKTSQAPATARRFGITLVPADVVATPRGEILDKKVGAMDASQYVNYFGRLAANARQGSSQQPPMTASYGRPAPPATSPYSGAPQTMPVSNPPASHTPPPPSHIPPPAYSSQRPVTPETTPPRIEIPAGNPPLALDGYCPVMLTERAQWVEGNPRYGARHEGRTYLFAGPEEQHQFFAAPNRYAPAFSGNDLVLLVEQGRTETGDRRFGGWYNDRIYLFTSQESFQRFIAAPEKYVTAANRVASRYAAPTTPTWQQRQQQMPNMPPR